MAFITIRIRQLVNLVKFFSMFSHIICYRVDFSVEHNQVYFNHIHSVAHGACNILNSPTVSIH